MLFVPAPSSNPLNASSAPVRRNLMLGTAGHVDHGKTALVKLLTGCETDTLAEEKERGLTIDLGFAPCRFADQRVAGIVDVPGHVDFIRNMVAGAQGIDVVILVVAADDGIMPQTREHLQILTLMGLQHGLVALTKTDIVDEARRDAVTADLRRLLQGTFLAQAPICPVSNITGDGYPAFFDALNDVVDACPDRPCSGVFRLWVEDVFAIRGAGTVVTGIPSSGTVRVCDELVLLPGTARARVRRLQVYGAESPDARAGECVALNLPDLDVAGVKRGMVLADQFSPAPTLFAEGELHVLDSIRGGIDDLLEVHAHIGTTAVLAKVALLDTDHLGGDRRGMVQLRFTAPIPTTIGEHFVLRGNVAYGGQSAVMTIGGGRVLGLSNTRLRRKKAWTLSNLAERKNALATPESWCEQVIREAEGVVIEAWLPGACGVRPEELTPVIQALRQHGHVLKLTEGKLVHAATVERAADKLLAVLRDFHQAHPQRAGMPKPEWIAQSGLDSQVCEAAAIQMLDGKRISATGDTVALAGWTVRVSNPDQALCDELLACFSRAGYSPPDTAQLAEQLKQPGARLQKMTQLLIDQGKLVRVDAALVLHREALEAAKAAALALFRKQPRFTTMEFRDALGVSRKYAVPVLDFLDKIRFTVRNGHDRTPGAEARKLLSP